MREALKAWLELMATTDAEVEAYLVRLGRGWRA